MKSLVCAATLVFLWAGFVGATTDWRYYKKECNGNKSCMRAQAAAYEEIKGFSEDIAGPCKKRYADRYHMDYSSALRCAKDERARRTQDKLDRAEAKEMNARANFLNNPTITIRHGYTVYPAQPQRKKTRKPVPETTQERMERLIRERDKNKQ